MRPSYVGCQASKYFRMEWHCCGFKIILSFKEKIDAEELEWSLGVNVFLETNGIRISLRKAGVEERAGNRLPLDKSLLQLSILVQGRGD